MNWKKIKKILLTVLIILIIIIVGIILYDRITVNNQYYINEANIDIPIFVYHDIVDDASKVEYDYMQTPKDIFEKQIKGLKDYGYHFITYEDLKKYKNNEIKLYKKSCILTFDDGFEGVYKNAYPIAKKYNIPFSVFIITYNVDTEKYMTWEQVKEMKQSGLITIASHSLDHKNFQELTTEETVNNVNESYKIMEKNLGKQDLKIFTYPYGLYKDEQNIEMGKLGYIQNLTDNRINKSKNLNLSQLHRIYPLNDTATKIILKIFYRSLRYN